MDQKPPLLLSLVHLRTTQFCTLAHVFFGLYLPQARSCCWQRKSCEHVYTKVSAHRESTKGCQVKIFVEGKKIWMAPSAMVEAWESAGQSMTSAVLLQYFSLLSFVAGELEYRFSLGIEYWLLSLPRRQARKNIEFECSICWYCKIKIYLRKPITYTCMLLRDDCILTSWLQSFGTVLVKINSISLNSHLKEPKKLAALLGLHYDILIAHSVFCFKQRVVVMQWDAQSHHSSARVFVTSRRHTLANFSPRPLCISILNL